MSQLKTPPFVHMHADILDHLVPHTVQVEEPATDDATALPGLFEQLEEALWRPALELDEADASFAIADVDEVLHPVAGIELDA